MTSSDQDIVNQTFGGIEFKRTLYSPDASGYLEIPTQIANRYGSFSYDQLALDRQTAELVRLWVSIKYKCSYCTVFHTQAARDAGIDVHKIDNITAYRRSELYTDSEVAALDYAAAISDVDHEKLPDATAEVRKHFTNPEVETIIMCTVLMDMWARIFAAQGNVPYYSAHA